MPTQNFRVGEMLNKRTRNSKTWINFDGSYTTEIYPYDIHYQDENGNWHNINTHLYDEADLDQVDFPVAKEGAEEFRIMKTAALNLKKKNILDRDSLDFQGLKVPFDCRIPRNFKRGYVIGKGQHKLRFIPVGVSPTKGFLDENQKNKITYQDPWNDTDVTLEVLPNGIKETIILKSSESPTKFTFEVDGPLEDDLTAGNLKLQPAWLQDANGEKRDVSQTVRREGDKTYIDLVADVTGLVYPIEIDPTVTIQPDGTAVKDAYVLRPSSTSNYGNNINLRVGGNDASRSYLQFDLSSIPSGADVVSASLTLLHAGYYNQLNITTQCFLVTQAWDESTITWDTQPTFDSNVSSSSLNFYTGSGGQRTWDVKNIVSNWISTGVNNGLVLKQTDTAWAEAIFYSSDNSSANDRPKLTITYNLPPTAPTVTSPNGGETWNSLHTITWDAATDKIEQYTSVQKRTTNKTQSLAANCQGAGQSFKVNSTDHIYKVGMYVNATPSQKLKAGTVINLRYYNEVTHERGEIISTYTLPNDVTKSGFVYAEFDNPQSFPLNTSLAVEFINPTGLGANILGSSGVGGMGDNYYIDPSGGIIYRSNDPFELEVYYGQPSVLQYQIQLTTDNGQNWKDIVPLTSPGATSYTYDFINEPETSLAKIRIRAYDGTSYGPWDESDGVFTIQHNQAPTVPTNLSPSGGASVDRASVVRLSWQHNDPNSNDPQSQFDLQWRKQGDATWNDVSQVTTNQYWDAPEGTFPKGTIEWRVRTYDQAGLSSPFSDIQTFFAGDKPANPMITDPTNGAIVPVANPVVQWSSVGQTGYHVKLLDSNDNLLWEIQANSPNKAQTVLYDLQNNTDYQIRVAIKNADNLWSDFVTSNIHVSYTPPAVPIVTTTKGEGVIIVSIDNPTPTGTEPNVSYNDLYRREQGESNWTRIATNIPADTSFVDYTPASGQIYEYYVRAWGDNGTYSDSAVVSESISLTGVWLHEADNPLETLHQFKLVSERSENWQPTAAMMQFAGRRLPIAEYDDTEQRSVSVKITVLKNSDDREAIERLIRSKNTLCYRDARGRKMFCHAFQLPVDDETYGNTVNLTFEEVSYTEEV
jgi:hypothetical protein